MHPRTTALACGACLFAGVITGVAASRVFDEEPEPSDQASDPARRERLDLTSSPTSSREPGPSAESRAGTERERSSAKGVRTRSRSSVTDPSRPGAAPSDPALHDPEDDSPEDPDEALDRLRRELLELRDEQREVMGEPVEPPADIEPRFGGASMAGAVRGALGQANVPGEVEATDCSEHPCIVFGRLEGDEEDMEEVERATALSVYDGDVLTLLFWATSVEEPGATPTETGLFALAFYSFEDRASRGEQLDRRIRARTMEYWNHDRPGRSATPDP